MQTSVRITTLKYRLPIPTALPYGKISASATYLRAQKLRPSSP